MARFDRILKAAVRLDRILKTAVRFRALIHSYRSIILQRLNLIDCQVDLIVLLELYKII